MQSSKFDKAKSVLSSVYIYFSANDPAELWQIYMDADQALMQTAQWDYRNSSLVTNQIVQMIKKIGLESVLDPKEKKLICNILWMWHHHAVSCALWRYGDKQAAQKYATKALAIQPAGHSNKITRLLYHLVHDELDKAEKWVQNITEEPEKTTATHSLDLYKKGVFFKPQVR